MNSYELPFAKITLLYDNIAEVVINEGVEMNLEMVSHYHDFLLSNLRAPFSVLVNKVNHYTYDFEAQCNLASLKEMNSIAVVAYNRTTRITTETVISMPREIPWNVRIFDARDKALNWLLFQNDNNPINS